MPLHIADYLADTGHLTATEHGAYLLLIMHYWQNGALPENERLIARIAKLDQRQWEESRDVLAMLFNEGWKHSRIDAELSKADDIIEKRKKAAEARFTKSNTNAHDEQVHSTSLYMRVPTDNRQPTTNDEANVGRETSEVVGPRSAKPSREPAARGSRLPADWTLPDEWLQWALSEFPSLPAIRLKREAEGFRDYWIAKAGRDAAKRDWEATWRNWVRKIAPSGPPRASPNDRWADDPAMRGVI